MTKTDKKIFCIGGKEFTLVKGVRWYLDYYVNERGIPERRRACGGHNRIKDLQAREDAFYNFAVTIAQPSGSVLNDALKEARPLLRLKTWQSQSSRLRIFQEWLAGRSPAISVKDATAFITHLLEKGLGSATVGGYRNSLSSIYKKAGLSNPWRAVAMPRVVSRSLMYFTPKQAAGLLQRLRASDPQLALAAQMLYYCFIRPGEMRLLTVDCINLEQGTITVPAGISKNKKTGTVVIPGCFLKELEALKLYRLPEDFFLFGKYGRPGRVMVGKNHFNRWHRKALTAEKIKGRYAFYSWKHTGAVCAVKAGINLKDLQMQLRHHSLDQVNEYLKDLGVLDSEDLRMKFPSISM